jgi:hypothetical protein
VIVVADAMEASAVGLDELRGMPGLPAAESGRIVRIEGDALLRPAPRAVEALPALASALHPGLVLDVAPAPGETARSKREPGQVRVGVWEEEP